MLFLPALVVGRSRRALPMADRSAALVAEMLLSEDPAEAVPACTRQFRGDPPFVLWAVCVAARQDEALPRSIAEVAEWISRKALAVLPWDSNHGEPSRPQIDTSAEQFGDLVAASLEVAGLAARLASSDGSGAADEAYLDGLLCHARQWLALPEGRGAAAPARELDVWPGTKVPARRNPHVPEAMEILAGRCSREGMEAAVEDCRRRAAEGRRLWLEALPGMGSYLPGLVRRLARLEQLEKQFQETLEAEKVEALAEFAAGAGHEINNPLAIIAGRAQLLLKDEPDPERQRELALIGAQVKRAHEMIADLRLFARPPRPELKPVDLVELVDNVVSQLQPQAAERAITLRRVGGGGAVLAEADPRGLTVAVHALCKNSLEAIEYDGRIEVAVSGGASSVEIAVSDTGPGIAPEQRQHLFDPFYSARQAGRGLGMGLSKCWRIVASHGGRMSVDSNPGQGARFTITLPGSLGGGDGVTLGDEE